MAYRYHSRAIVDPSAPSAWGQCDRCAKLYNLRDLRWQMQYNGTGLYNTRFLVCERCLDIPQPQLLTPILPADPLPVQNPRPPNYAYMEVDNLSTQDNSIIETESGEDIVVNQPSQNFSETP